MSSFMLDKYLVTVGRYRQFVRAWNAGYRPATGAGKHAYLNGGLGLIDSGNLGGYESGWNSADDANADPTSFSCGPDAAPLPVTWTDKPGSRETLPISCVSWYAAYAFCIWDDGFLPSEAEYTYAAAGGTQQRAYPWGSTPPGTSNLYAIHGDGSGTCDYPSLGPCTGVANIAPVGTAQLGAGRWGQVDLVGDVSEWTRDGWWGQYLSPSVDAAYLIPAHSVSGGMLGPGVLRGADFIDTADSLFSSLRQSATPGVRCARAP